MRSVQHYFFLIFFFLFLSVSYSCKKEGTIKKPVAKMTLEYMEANNDLRYDALNSINMMEKGAAALDGTLLVYIKPNSPNSYLLKINPDADENRIVSDTVK